jgi:hypothetical protein
VKAGSPEAIVTWLGFDLDDLDAVKRDCPKLRDHSLVSTSNGCV